jgi:hypothetical protein
MPGADSSNADKSDFKSLFNRGGGKSDIPSLNLNLLKK